MENLLTDYMPAIASIGIIGARLQKEFSALDELSRAEVARALDSSAAVEYFLTPSSKPGPDKVGCLPITTPSLCKGIDSWWR